MPDRSEPRWADHFRAWVASRPRGDVPEQPPSLRTLRRRLRALNRAWTRLAP